MALPTAGERFYFRALLKNFPARSPDGLRTVEGVVHETYRAATVAHGLFPGEGEGEAVMRECVAAGHSPARLRRLLMILVLQCGSSPACVLVAGGPAVYVDFIAAAKHALGGGAEMASDLPEVDAMARGFLLQDIRARLRADGQHERAEIEELRKQGYGDFFALAEEAEDAGAVASAARAYVRAHRPRYAAFVERHLHTLDAGQRAAHDAILHAAGGVHFL